MRFSATLFRVTMCGVLLAVGAFPAAGQGRGGGAPHPSARPSSPPPSPHGSPAPFTSTLLFHQAGKPEAKTPFLGRVPLQPYWTPFWWPETPTSEPTRRSLARVAAPAPPAPPHHAAPSLIQPLPGATLPRQQSKPTGVLHLEVQPTDAQVYVDGFAVGTVDALNAAGGLTLSAGWHRVEFRLPGYETAAVDVTIEADRTIVSRLTLRSTASS